jgi:hypothetical protein
LIYLQYLSAVESPNPDKGSDSGRYMAKYLNSYAIKTFIRIWLHSSYFLQFSFKLLTTQIKINNKYRYTLLVTIIDRQFGKKKIFKKNKPYLLSVILHVIIEC